MLDGAGNSLVEGLKPSADSFQVEVGTGLLGLSHALGNVGGYSVVNGIW